MYYTLIDHTNNYYYCNYSKNPKKSIHRHVHKAHNPASKYYNSPFYAALRDHLTDFTITICVDTPWFVQHLRHYEGGYLE